MAGTNTTVWAGRIVSGIVVLALLADAAVDLFSPAMIEAEMTATGFPANLAPVLGIIILVCAVLYAIPRTAVLGAILITGFLGGAICTHFRLGEMGAPPQIICLLLGVLTWAGLYLRDPRLRALLPLTTS
ncbi:DoxX family protein [Neorhizobium sp. P12A]|uniref:DoxX family protein n=1 Tax=Neorhizobium sp. P12A TaxID=2268027 RepID=UPI0011EE39A0|nr:DoxX family protein [Neorhizobium sp. P12A]KAA0689510.1 DoxX family protein [Neorhizobium sp. P12A]